MRGTIRRRPVLSGFLIWAIAVLIGAAVLLISLRSADQVRDALNHSVCGFRALVQPQLVRARSSAKDRTQSPTVLKRSRQAVIAYERFLSTQVTSPRNYDCKRILHDIKPPRKP